MGRAIVRQPQVFLFDEPLSNLDAKLRAQTRLEIQKLHRELGITPVRHPRPGRGHDLAQRMIVMNAGRMEQFGTPDEVYHRPASTFVAGFIGSPPMNLLTGIEGVREGVLLGIRPEHLRVADSGGWALHVQTVEMLGAERLIYGHLNGPQGPWTILRMNETEAPPAPGQQLHVLPLEDRIHGFDAATGLRIEA
jgi:sn-glycerol 3-phosphate transport system ATP-binding protein